VRLIIDSIRQFWCVLIRMVGLSDYLLPKQYISPIYPYLYHLALSTIHTYILEAQLSHFGKVYSNTHRAFS
jgi:hypothetical protein